MQEKLTHNVKLSMCGRDRGTREELEHLVNSRASDKKT